jgi:hypothetical protein
VTHQHGAGDRKATDEPRTDAADVVTGPVGSASLKDPATSGDIGADVHELPGVEAPDVEAGDDAPPDAPPHAVDTPRAMER